MPLALITGAAKRIGRSIALRLSREGFAVAAHYNASQNEALDLQREIQSQGGACTLFRADLSAPHEVPELFSEVLDKCGLPDLIVNNAALFINDDASHFSQEQFDLHMNVNLKAPVLLASEFFRHCGDGEDRLVVNLVDNKVFALNPDFFTYTISKFALRGATEMMAMRFSPNLRVCGIAPSVTLISGKQSQENFEKSWKITPLGRGPSPEEIAEAVLFMWRAKSYNGQVMVIDGGQSLMGLSRDVAFLVKEDLV